MCTLLFTGTTVAPLLLPYWAYVHFVRLYNESVMRADCVRVKHNAFTLYDLLPYLTPLLPTTKG